MGQFLLLLWKNWTLQRKKKLLTAFEIGIPTFFSLILLATRQLIEIDKFPNGTRWDSFTVEAIPEGLINATNNTWQVAYSPRNNVIKGIMEQVSAKLDVDIDGLGFDDEDQLVEFLSAENISLSYTILAGVVFTNDFPSSNALPDKVSYKIRPKSEQQFGNGQNVRISTSSDWSTDHVFPLDTTTEPREIDEADGGEPGYNREGFLALQRAIDLAIIKEQVPGAAVDDVKLVLKRHPYPRYENDPYVQVIQSQLPFIVLLSFIVTAASITKDVVLEKEKKLKEFMRMMGLQNWQHWLAWFIKYLTFTLISVIIMIIFLFIDLGNGSVLNHSDASLVFVFLLLYCITTILFCFALATFFSKASSGSAAGAILFLATYTPYSFLASRYEDLDVGSKSSLCLLHNVAMSFGCYLIGLYEGRGIGMKWNNFYTPINVNDDFTMLHVFILLLVDCLIYGLIAWYVDRIKPGDYGQALPFYFPCMKSYWCSGGGDEPAYAVDEEMGTSDVATKSAFFEQNPPNMPAGIKIRDLRKTFKKDGKTKVAVNGMTVDMFEGQITALLGHNGAGKTTTMFMLTGFLPPSSGTAYVNNYSIKRELAKARRSLGMCPQHNVLFDTMTVKEHLYFFGRLKYVSADDIDAEVENMIRILELVDKTDVQSMGLSGGMKRKLSVGIALIGGSKVVILDEPSSGMDPQARRALWDILQSQKQGRTMILSTHFMDEADFLGDRIAIMAEGEVQCCGTSMFLKGKYGVGYHMVIVKEPGCDVNRVTDVIKHYVPDAEMESNISAELSYVLPREGSSQFEAMFSHLEGRKTELGIASYGASVTTMEEVFLKVGESVDDTLEAKLKNQENGHPEGSDNAAYENNSISDMVVVNGHENPKLGAKVVGVREPTTHFEKNTGFHQLGQQFRALVEKRMIHSWRNKMVTIAQFLLPIAFTIVGCMVTESFPGPKDPPAMELTLTDFDSPVAPYATIDTSPGDIAVNLAEKYKDIMEGLDVSAPEVNDDDVEDYLADVGDQRFSKFINSYMVAASFESVNSSIALFYAYFNNEAYHTPAITLNNAANTLLHWFDPTGDSKSIDVENHPLPRSTSSRVAEETSTGFVVASIVSYNLFFGMCFLIGSFVLFIIKERESKAKHLQYVSGVHITTYWFSAFVWDLANFMAPTFVVIIVFAAFDIKPYYEGENGGVMILIFLMYGFAILPFVYLMSFMFSVPSSGNTWVTVLNLLIATICLIVVDILGIPSLNQQSLGDALEWAFLALWPSYCFLAGVRSIYYNYENLRVCNNFKNEFLLAAGQSPSSASLSEVCKYFESIGQEIACCPNSCDEDECVEFTEDYLDWEKPGIGRPLFFMFMQFLVCFLFVFFIDSGLSKFLREGMTSCLMGNNDHDQHHTDDNIPLTDQDIAEDQDVKEEHHRITHTPKEQLEASDSLVLAEIKKYYGNFLAVDELTLGVPQGECFGLLGVNGAGKTTTFKMLTGDETLSGGDAWLDGFSVKTNIKQAQQRMGYCPQFDAVIEQMTVQETLMMYGRLRGVQEAYLPQVVSNLIASLLLDDHVGKRAGDLSGGNKRKLSTAIALIGDPPIVFLDEPTTGMDPVARRLLWDTLTKVRATGRTLVLTSHSMEECEALCTRLAIMVNGKFKCLGSTQMLKSKFGDGYTLMAKIRSGHPADLQDQTAQLITFIENNFPGSSLKDKLPGYVHYHIAAGNKGWAELFGTMERAKDQLNLEDYSVSQTTLEQVFLNFARAQRVPRDTKMTTLTKCSNCWNFLFCGCCNKSTVRKGRSQ